MPTGSWGIRAARAAGIYNRPKTITASPNKGKLANSLLILQRRFLNLPSSWSEIAPRKERPQGWQAREQVAMEMCSRSFYCEPSL